MKDIKQCTPGIYNFCNNTNQISQNFIPGFWIIYVAVQTIKDALPQTRVAWCQA